MFMAALLFAQASKSGKPRDFIQKTHLLLESAEQGQGLVRVAGAMGSALLTRWERLNSVSRSDTEHVSNIRTLYHNGGPVDNSPLTCSDSSILLLCQGPVKEHKKK